MVILIELPLTNKLLRACLFDLDGVFIDSTHGWVIALQVILEKEGYPIPSSSSIEKIVALSTESQLIQLFPKLEHENIKRKRLVHNIDDYFIQNIDSHVVLFPNSFKVLKHLKDTGLVLGLVTNNQRKVALSVLRKFNLLDFFDNVTSLEDMSKPKPHPSGLIHTLERLNSTKHNSVYIGDSPSDLKASSSTGIPFILIERPNTNFDFPKLGPEVLIIQDLLELISF